MENRMIQRSPRAFVFGLLFLPIAGLAKASVAPAVRADVVGKIYDLEFEQSDVEVKGAAGVVAGNPPRFLFDTFIEMSRAEAAKPASRRRRTLISNFKESDGTLATQERVELIGDRTLKYVKDERQTGVYSEAILEEPTKVVFRKRQEDGSFDESSERVRDPENVPAVAGPMVTFYMQQKYKELDAGETVKFRMVVPDRMETIGFRLRLVERPDSSNQVTIQMEPSSWVIRMLVTPTLFRVDLDEMSLLSVRSQFPMKVKNGSSFDDYKGKMMMTAKKNDVRIN
jgi:hypothetical protein